MGQYIHPSNGKFARGRDIGGTAMAGSGAEAHDDQDLSRPPLACAACQLGHFAFYGPTKIATSDQVYTRRRSVVTLRANKVLLREDEPVHQIFTLYSGWAFSFKQMPDGRRQILSFLIPGDALILESLCFPGLKMPFSVKALTAIAVCSFDLREMAALTVATEAQSQALADLMRNHMSSLNQRLFDIGRKSALGRVSQLLLEIEERLRNRQLSVEGAFHFPARQEHVADALGLTTVYVNRILDRLRRRDIIRYDRAHMHILDFDALQELAEVE